jgi:hypothetical protein
MFRLLLVAFAAGTLASAAGATQFTITSDVDSGAGGVTYIGPVTSTYQGNVNDGGRDALDGYGYYLGFSDSPAFGGLTATRQVEAITALNVYRFFDTFTNNSASTIDTILTFAGNLGSDDVTHVLASGPNYLVSCQWNGTACFSDPVVASISGNNGLGTIGFLASPPDTYNASFHVTVAPGASISLLNFVFLASDENGTAPSDTALAIDTAQSLVAHPYLDGLTDSQIGNIVNFSFGASPAPEPASWATMLIGFGVIGSTVRRRRFRMTFA